MKVFIKIFSISHNYLSSLCEKLRRTKLKPVLPLLVIMEEKPLLSHKPNKRKRFHFTVEPTMLFHLMVFIISDTLLRNMLLNLTCENIDYSDNSCNSEADSQVIVSQLLTLKNSTSIIIAILVTIFAGTFIDKHVEYLRWFLFLPPVCQLILDILHFANISYFRWSAFTTTTYATLLVGAGGSSICILMACSTYMSHVSTKEERTVRMGYMMLASTLGSSVGFLTGGYAVQYLGYFFGYLVCILLGSCALVWGLLFVKDIEYVSKDASSSNLLMQFTEGVRVLRKKRSHHQSLIIYLLIVVYMIIHFYPAGELSVLYLYLRSQLDWDSVTYGTYSAYRMMINCGGILICSEILKRRLKLRDATVGIIGGIFEIFYIVSWFLVTETCQVYAAGSLSLLENAIISVCLSLASKCVEPDEYGRLSSIFGMSNFLMPIVIVIYNGLYELTIYTYPTAIFLLSATFCAPMFVIFSILLHFEHKIPICNKFFLKNKSGTVNEKYCIRSCQNTHFLIEQMDLVTKRITLP